MVERQRLSFDNVAEILLRTDPLDYETGNPPGAFAPGGDERADAHHDEIPSAAP